MRCWINPFCSALACRASSAFAPKTRLGLTVRNLATRLLRIPLLATFLLGRDLRDEIALPDYGF